MVGFSHTHSIRWDIQSMKTSKLKKSELIRPGTFLPQTSVFFIPSLLRSRRACSHPGSWQ